MKKLKFLKTYISAFKVARKCRLKHPWLMPLTKIETHLEKMMGMPIKQFFEKITMTNNLMTKQYRKLFFTCPIRAAYMNKEFGVSFRRPISIFRVYEGEPIEFVAGEAVKMYVAPESEPIFEPKEKDMLNGGSFVFSLGGELKAFNMEGARLIGSNEKIIMRDNKQFFPAEVEDDK